MAKQWSKAPNMEIDPNKKYTAILHTEKGDITIELFAKDVPNTVNNFVFLSRQHYYDGITFHRVIPGFMAQTGDPDPRELGSGGPGYTIDDEEGGLKLKHSGPGVVSMAKTQQPNTGGSQFFITLGKTDWLDRIHTIFGRVTDGMDVVKVLTPRDPQKDRFHGDRIQSVEIIES